MEKEKLIDLLYQTGEYLLSCQTKEGGICNYPINNLDNYSFYDRLLMVYNFAPLGLLKTYEITKDKKYLESVKRWIGFWATYQNLTEDRFGFTGTFYDWLYDRKFKNYRLRCFYEENTANKGGAGYDSIDAYQSIFLLVIRNYYKLTDDKSLVQSLNKNIQLAAESILSTIDADGLTWCHPNWPYKYMMDVTETYAGISAAVDLFEILEIKALKEKFVFILEKMKEEIVSWWVSDRNDYIWAKIRGLKPMAYAQNDERLIRKDTTLYTDWEKWFPDVCENLWPVLWGVVSPDDKKSKIIWGKVNKYHAEWIYPEKYSFVVQLSYIAILMRDIEKAESAIENLKNGFNSLKNPQNFGLSHEYGFLPYTIEALLIRN